MELNVILMWVECVIHFAIFFILYVYRDHTARQRWGISALAIGLAGANIGLAILLALGAFKAGPAMAHMLLIIAFGCIFGLLIRARGNVAKMIQPLKPKVSI